MPINAPYLSLMKSVHPLYMQFYLGRRLRTLQNWPFTKSVEESEFLDAQELKDLQGEKLKKIAHHAESTVPFYQRIYKSKNVNLQKIKTVDDIQLLPTTSKAEMRGYNLFNDLTSNTVDTSRCQLLRTSGTTGTPFFHLRSVQDLRKMFAYGMFRRWKWAGLKHTAREIAMGNRELLAEIDKDSIKPNCLRMGPRDIVPKEFVDLIKAYEPDCIRAYPEILTHIGRYVKDRGMDLHIQAALPGGNIMLESDRKTIEAAFNTSVFESYVSSEFEIVASECEHHQMHLYSDHTIVETFNDRMESDPRGGRAFITNLDRFSMPHIRFDTGDIIEFKKGRCKCNRTLPLIKKIPGRITDVVITPTGEKILFLDFARIIQQSKEVINFKIVQDARDHILVELHVSERFGRTDKSILFRGLSELTQGMSFDINLRNEEFPNNTVKKLYRIQNKVYNELCFNS